jgi:predicted transcriptional regulator
MLTSSEAARTIDARTLETEVYKVISQAGPGGIHSDEVRRLMPGLAYSSVTARFSSLARAGRIWFPGTTRTGDSGRQQRVMVADRWTQ